MSKFKLTIIITLLVAISGGIFVYYKYTTIDDYQKNVETYAEFLKEDPQSCFYNEQMAANYQALGNWDQAINYYEISLRNCPDNLINT